MALINAVNEAAKKERKDVYSGPATVVDVGAVEARWTDGLSDKEKAAAFDIELRVKPDNPDVDETTITIPVTARVPKFDKQGRTEMQIAVEDLNRQGLIVGGDISTIMAAKGKTCNVWIYDETSAKGTFRRARLSVMKARLDPSELIKKLSLMTGRAVGGSTPAPAPTVNPFV